MKTIVSLFALALLAVVTTAPAQALESKPTSRAVVEGMCGGGIQSGGGHTGCTICTTKMCTDDDCTKKGCKLVNIIKGQPGSIRTGANTINSRNTPTGEPHPINTGAGFQGGSPAIGGRSGGGRGR
ncbi:MAG: hypothetical protein JO000_07170 [Alphaproteobacteria bacterium]|nr:hypothetical protein [Alphaproteobacteria bacterium]